MHYIIASLFSFVMATAALAEEAVKEGDVIHAHGQWFKIKDIAYPTDHMGLGDDCKDHSRGKLTVLHVAGDEVVIKYEGENTNDYVSCPGQFTTSVTVSEYQKMLVEDRTYRVQEEARQKTIEAANKEKRDAAEVERRRIRELLKPQ